MDQAVIEFRAHGYPDAARRLAERTIAWIQQLPPADQKGLQWALPDLLVEAGHLTEARQLAAQQLAEEPDDPDGLTFLATISAEQGDGATARRIDARLARIADPHLRRKILVSRAGIAASLGEREAAVGLLREALRVGWGGRYWLHFMREFAPLRGYPPFEALARPVD